MSFYQFGKTIGCKWPYSQTFKVHQSLVNIMDDKSYVIGS
jgi:hypothetical protein